jgi:hypothetical protein
MFSYLTWKNKRGEVLRALLQEEKAIKISKLMRNLGVDVSIIPEKSLVEPIPTNKLN